MPATVVVTGAGAGVGRATAKEFAAEGCKLALLGRGRERLEDAAREIRARGGVALPIVTDVGDAAQVEHAADRIEQELGPIETWVNNAMVTIFAPLAEITAEEFRRVTEVTYLGQVHGTMSALRRMRRRDHGTIVQVGSALSYRSIPLQSPYCGAKFAVRGFTDSVRSELAHDRSQIRITMVQLPAVNTPQFDWARSRLGRKPRPLPPIYQPESVAREIVRAAHEAPRELWIGRSALKAIVGTMLLPSLGDELLASEGYGGQMSNETAPERAGNLFEAVAGDPGARGRFDQEAQNELFAVDPAVLRAGALVGLIAAMTGAFALGRSMAASRAVARGTSITRGHPS